MSYQPRTLFRLIEATNRHLFLPHIQRPFVWSTDQMRRLFDSLMRDYPIQTLLFWRTTDAIKARRFMDVIDWDPDLSDYYDEPMSREGVEKVFVLDGQQRLQTLYALFRGGVMSEDGGAVLHAYACLTDGGEAAEPDDDGLLYRLRFSATHPGPTYYRLADLLGPDEQKDREDIADRLNDALDTDGAEASEGERKDRQGRVRRNVSRIVSLVKEERHFWAEELDGVANDYPYSRVLDIFVRVNSGGTKLDAADLMFAAMKEGWTEIEEHIEGVADMLSETSLSFDKSVVLKCLVVAHGHGAELTPKKLQQDVVLDAIRTEWDRAEETFKQLRDFIKTELGLYGDKVVRSYGAFVPLFDYLFHNPKPDEASRQQMRGYHYKAQMFNWFSAGTDKVINAVHNIVGKQRSSGFPLAEVKAYFEKNGRSVVLDEAHLRETRTRYIVLNAVYVDQFGISPFDVRFSGNAPHVDHIYPQSRLRSKLGYGSPDVNHLGNFRFVGATDNIRKRAEEPASYFARLKTAGVPIHKHLLLDAYSDDPSKLDFTRAGYEAFRDARFARLHTILSRIVNPELGS